MCPTCYSLCHSFWPIQFLSRFSQLEIGGKIEIGFFLFLSCGNFNDWKWFWQFWMSGTVKELDLWHSPSKIDVEWKRKWRKNRATMWRVIWPEAFTTLKNEMLSESRLNSRWKTICYLKTFCFNVRCIHANQFSNQFCEISDWRCMNQPHQFESLLLFIKL